MAIHTAPPSMQSTLSHAPAVAAVMAEFIKKALVLMPDTLDNNAESRMALDGTDDTGDKQARLWLHVNTEAIAGDEYILIAFLYPIVNAWHPYVQKRKYNLWVTTRAARLVHGAMQMLDEELFRSRCDHCAPDFVPDPRVPDSDDSLHDSDMDSDEDS